MNYSLIDWHGLLEMKMNLMSLNLAEQDLVRISLR